MRINSHENMISKTKNHCDCAVSDINRNDAFLTARLP